MIDEDALQFVSFCVGSQEFAIEILQLRRVLSFATPTPMPGAPAWLAGIIPFEGAPLPVIDLRARLGLDAAVTPETRVLVLDLGAGPLGVVVDATRRVERVAAVDVGAPPDVAGLAPGMAVGLIDRPGRPLVILNPSRLLSSEERAELAAMLVPA